MINPGFTRGEYWLLEEVWAAVFAWWVLFLYYFLGVFLKGEPDGIHL